jgi:dTDP-4-dehydrorhamnose 3,5-epimerase-like enzyme
VIQFAKSDWIIRAAAFCVELESKTIDEGGIVWDDPTLNIQWPLEAVATLIISEKDRKLPRLVV